MKSQEVTGSPRTFQSVFQLLPRYFSTYDGAGGEVSVATKHCGNPSSSHWCLNFTKALASTEPGRRRGLNLDSKPAAWTEVAFCCHALAWDSKVMIFSNYFKTFFFSHFSGILLSWFLWTLSCRVPYCTLLCGSLTLLCNRLSLETDQIFGSDAAHHCFEFTSCFIWNCILKTANSSLKSVYLYTWLEIPKYNIWCSLNNLKKYCRVFHQYHQLVSCVE